MRRLVDETSPCVPWLSPLLRRVAPSLRLVLPDMIFSLATTGADGLTLLAKLRDSWSWR